ncbi:hypothetical protein NMY22_g4330 [Coprinellus aureogranulatus]|nr:hypothetical protein NMY22_g4330 [Coprinellus aureogranulatus]
MTFETANSSPIAPPFVSPPDTNSNRNLVGVSPNQQGAAGFGRTIADLARAFGILRVVDPAEEAHKARMRRWAALRAEKAALKAELGPLAPCDCCVNLEDHQRKHRWYTRMNNVDWTLHGLFLMFLVLFGIRFIVGAVSEKAELVTGG